MKRKMDAPWLRFAVVGSLALMLLLAGIAPAHADTFGGRAFAAFVQVPSLGASGMYLTDSGELGPGGGWEGAGLLGAQVPSVLSATVLNAATSGADGQASSSASLGDVVVLPGQVVELTASFVRAEATAIGPGSQGSVEIHDLVLGGVPVPVTGLPNQRVEVPGLLGSAATLIINEQSVTSDGVSQTITVNALHLILATGEEVILGSARSHVDPTGDIMLSRARDRIPAVPAVSGGGACPTPVRKLVWSLDEKPPIILTHPGECIDFVTGGGFFEPPNSTRPGRVNFGFNAGPRSLQNRDPKGHLNHVDHSGGPIRHIKGVNVDGYVEWGGDLEHCRVFAGDAVVDGVPGFRYNAVVCDYGEPGRDDRYMLEVFNGAGVSVYFADNRAAAKAPERGELDGGNIQLHRSKCPKASFSEPDGALAL